ncbi:Sentrin-specific protease [Astathelohania contejeani]|uniref:Sentrin-specific protease n=1 Tax=Astathelohania contejeani TaxID=164912 RepID=A0ABQ7I2J8_9MICR|nr:Sentrin-specific protease [Thelohania contejeani]
MNESQFKYPRSTQSQCNLLFTSPIPTKKTSSYHKTISKYGIDITAEDFATLTPSGWLNDKIINYYFEMIREYASHLHTRIYVFSTYFYPTLLRKGPEWIHTWTRGEDIFSYTYVFIPVHLGAHWIFICVDMNKRMLEYYDSLGGVDKNTIKAILGYFRSERIDAEFKIMIKKHIPRQTNSDDCGVFTCYYAKKRIMSLVFHENINTNELRREMIEEIKQGRINP